MFQVVALVIFVKLFDAYLKVISTILRNAHLMGVSDGPTGTRLPHNFRFHDSLDSFQAFYVNKFIDYHTHEIAF